MTENTAYYITAKKLAKAGLDGVPSELKSSEHLIYSSPAALSFNSPGAQGFGVKRAALAVPGSIELLVAPGCCGRNTTILSRSGGYRDRFFYLLMDDTDIVTGRHLRKIPEAVKEAADSCDEKPSCVMICITCVDALLGTDMERVCRRASEYAGLPVLPSYMYALTREGREPPMTSVRKSIYSLLEKRKRKSDVVNILGEFAPLSDDSEIYEILKSAGVKKINEISRLTTFEEYLEMSEANFNIVVNPE
jgi:nitrogenase molybdenum-cofactor synthesis protein NifE